MKSKPTADKKMKKQVTVTHVIPLYGVYKHRATPKCPCQPERLNKPRMGVWYLHQSGSNAKGQCRFVMKKEDV